MLRLFTDVNTLFFIWRYIIIGNWDINFQEEVTFNMFCLVVLYDVWFYKVQVLLIMV